MIRLTGLLLHRLAQFFMDMTADNEIYVLGMANAKSIVKIPLQLVSICGIDRQDIRLVNSLKHVN